MTVDNITQLFFEASNRFPDKIAIIEKDKSILYRDMAIEVRQTAAYLVSRGIRRGDRIMVFVPMSIELYTFTMAIFQIGAVAVFLDEWASKERLNVSAKLAECIGFAGGWKARLYSYTSSELRKIKIKLNPNKKMSVEADIINVGKDEPALITFTTGSTGIPKAVVRSHDFLYEQFKALMETSKPHSSDIDMTVLPIILFINLAIGCTSVIADFNGRKPGTLNAKKILAQIEKYKILRLTASPFFIKVISKEAISQRKPITSIKNIFTGGAPVFPGEAILYRKAFPKSEITIVYGSTEAEPISEIEVDELIDSDDITKGLNVGKIYKGAELKIIDVLDRPIKLDVENGIDSIELPIGETGEIIIAGNHVNKHYYNNQKAFEENKIVEGEKIWHRTGDSGYIGQNGNLFLSGRCAQIINISGERIYPFIYENYLASLEGVRIGTVIEKNGKVILIIESDLRLEDIEIEGLFFDSIEVVSKIPRDPRHNSKIDYGKLKELVQF